MRRTFTVLLLLSLVVSTLPAYSTSAAGDTFSEDFGTTAHMDAANTTAHWDTSSGLLKLPPTQPVAAQAIGTLGGPHLEFPAVYVPEKKRAYLVGGMFDFHRPRSNAIREYDPLRNVVDRQMRATMPSDRSAASAAYASAARKIYIFGGETTWTKYRDILEFDPFSDTLTTLTVRLPQTLHHGVAVYVPTNNRVYLFGGLSRAGPSADIIEFDVATRSVKVLSAGLPSARWDPCAAYDPGTQRVYVFGGLAAGGVALDEIVSFDPGTGAATLLATRLPLGLTRSSAVYVPEAARILLFGGEKQGGPFYKQVIAFQPSTGGIATTTYALPGEGVKGAAVVHSGDSGWLALLGGDARFGRWASKQYLGILRLRWEGADLRQYDNFLPFEARTSTAVYVPEENKAYLFGGDRVHITQFDFSTSVAYTKTATLPVPSVDPGTVWVPGRDLAYLFDAAGGIYTYDPISDTVATRPRRLPRGFDPRVATYAPSRNAVYLFDSAEGSGKILRYNLADDTLTTLSARMHPARRAAYAVYVPSSNLIFVLGGWQYHEGVWDDTIWVFGVANETLSGQQGLRLPRPGEFKAALLLPPTDDIYLIGGYGGWSLTYAFPFEQLWRFDTTPARTIVELPLTQPSRLGYQAAVWNSTEDRFYTFGGFWKTAPDKMGSSNLIQRFELGHTESAVAQSTRVNSGSSNVLQARLTKVEELHDGRVDYFLSNDGAATWEAVTPGVDHTFASTGSDLRWKAVLHGDGTSTPVVDKVTIRWGADTNQPPVNGTLSPTDGGAPAGSIVYFTSTCLDPDGEADLKACRLHVGRWDAPKSLIGNAVLVYQARTNKLLIRNDKGTRWWGGKLVGSANVVQNGQVKAYCNLTTVSRSGNQIQVRWGVEFKPAFRGRTKVYLKARDVGGLTSPLERKGSWTVQ
jgi:hypothetical protein